MIGIPSIISEQSATTLFYLLYANYGNNQINSTDLTRWKYKLFSLIYQYGPVWEKKLDIQTKLRNLTDDQLITGSKDIFNHAMNPATTVRNNEEIDFINEQNMTLRKKYILDGYANLEALLEDNITSEFINRFKSLFRPIVQPDNSVRFTADSFIEIDYSYSDEWSGTSSFPVFTDIYDSAEKFIKDYKEV